MMRWCDDAMRYTMRYAMMMNNNKCDDVMRWTNDDAIRNAMWCVNAMTMRNENGQCVMRWWCAIVNAMWCDDIVRCDDDVSMNDEQQWMTMWWWCVNAMCVCQWMMWCHNSTDVGRVVTMSHASACVRVVACVIACLWGALLRVWTDSVCSIVYAIHRGVGGWGYSPASFRPRPKYRGPAINQNLLFIFFYLNLSKPLACGSRSV